MYRTEPIVVNTMLRFHVPQHSFVDGVVLESLLRQELGNGMRKILALPRHLTIAYHATSVMKRPRKVKSPYIDSPSRLGDEGLAFSP
jgi:hypothetical protein